MLHDDRRTLVITLAQLRAHQLMRTNFKENVLDQLYATSRSVCRTTHSSISQIHSAWRRSPALAHS